MANPSLSEYISQSQRGLYQSVFGPDFMKKAAFQSSDAGIFTTTYGRKVWQALNNQTRFFNAIPRVVWGNTAGWRVRSDRGTNRSLPIKEAGALPTVDVSLIETVSSLPRIVGTTFGASVKAVFAAQLEGGVGDVLALENENAQLDHMKEINQELMAGGYAVATSGTASTFASTGAGGAAIMGNNFRVGDEVFVYDESAGVTQNLASGTAARTIGTIADGTMTLQTPTGGSIETWAGSLDVDANDILSVRSRAGLTSLDDVVMDKTVTVAAGGSNAGIVENNRYNLEAPASGDWDAPASVQMNGGTGRDLSLNLLDTAIQRIRENGGEPKLLLMGHDQYFKLERLLNSQQRYMGQEEYQVGVGSERTFPGTRTGLVLATYMGIPILPDADVSKSMGTAGVGQGSVIYALDTDFLEIAVAQPTQYIENRDYFAANQLVVRGLLYTMGELRCRNFFVQAKIGNLNA